MMNTAAETPVTIQVPTAPGLRSLPSIGDQQAHMAYASLRFNPGAGQASVTAAIQHDLLASTRPTSRVRLESEKLGSPGPWAEADERCPYCKSEGYVLYAHPLGNLTLLEGTCRFCGMHSLSLLG